MKKIKSIILCMLMVVCICATAYGEAAPAAAIEIATAEELAAVAENLSGSYVLTADIDLGGVEWTPIGAFLADDGEEMPDAAYAFTGSFDGNGHTISNYTINQPDGWAVGLFGCVSEAVIQDLTVENATVDGGMMVGAVVGYAYCSTLSGITLDDATVTAHTIEGAEEAGMIGGVVGAGMGSMVTDCQASAAIIVPDNQANIGIIGGGLEGTSLVNCTASGSIVAGDNCYGLGGVSGCGFGAEEIRNCTAQQVSITTGEGCFWVGGVVGYAGGYEDENVGVPVTRITGCEVSDITMELGEGSQEGGEIVGGSFYFEELGEAYGAPYDQPTVYVIEK